MRAFYFLWAVQGFAAFNLTWGSPAMDLHPQIDDIDGNAAIATDPMGNAVATWSRTTGKGASEDVWTSSYDHAQRVWTGAVKISSGAAATNARVAVDNDGNAILVWEESFPSQIMSKTLSAQGIWGPTTPLHKTNNTQTSPQISIDALGNAVAIWMEYFDGAYHIESAKKNLSLPWHFLGTISAGTLTSAKALVTNDSGDALAVWEEDNGTVRGAQYLNGAWLKPLTIGTGAYPSVGIDNGGDGVVVWSQDKQIWSRRLIDGALSDHALRISDPTYPAFHPDIGVDGKGNAIVVFERSNPLYKFIAAVEQSYNASSWTAPIDISGPSPVDMKEAGHPVLSLNSIGDGVAIWKEANEMEITIQGAGYALGTWAPSKMLSSFKDSAGAFLPSYAISINTTGNIMAVWPQAPSQEEPPHLKATSGMGLANIGPMPPVIDPESLRLDIIGVASGKQILHRFPAHADLINVLIWESPGGVAYFRIYRNNLSTLIDTSTVPRYEDHQRVPKRNETYLITSVDNNGQESSPITLVVHPR